MMSDSEVSAADKAAAKEAAKAAIVAAEARRYRNAEIGRTLTAICKRNSPATARAEFDEALADVKATIASGEFTPTEWLSCLRRCA